MESQSSVTLSLQQKEWLTAEEASQLSGRSQIAMRALIQATLEDDEKKHLIKARSDEAAGAPFSFYLHRSLIDEGTDSQVASANTLSDLHQEPAEAQLVTAEEAAPTLSGASREEVADLKQEIERLQHSLEHQAVQLHELKQSVASQQPVSSQSFEQDWLSEDKATGGNQTSPEESHVSSQPESAEGSMTYLWVALAIVTIFALGAAYVVLDRLGRLPEVLQLF